MFSAVIEILSQNKKASSPITTRTSLWRPGLQTNTNHKPQENSQMTDKILRAKAERLLQLHHDPKLLVLPNVWDPLGAGLLESLGFPAAATASAAVAFSQGHDDGENIAFEDMLQTIKRIGECISIPLTADIERGYAKEPERLAENIRMVISAGAAGINLEDSTIEGGPLYSIDFQCARIKAARKAASNLNIPLVINARIDTFLRDDSTSESERLEETIDRARAYVDAGADCIYPITVSDLDSLGSILRAVKSPINVLASGDTPSMIELEAAGISRISLGPGMLKASVATMKRVALTLQAYGPYDLFTHNVPSSEEIKDYILK